MSRTVKIATASELAPGEGKTVEVEGVSLALFNVGGTYFAITNECTHVDGPLGDGALEGQKVTCPWHGAQFDVTCGKALCGPNGGDAKSYTVSMLGNNVCVDLD